MKRKMKKGEKEKRRLKRDRINKFSKYAKKNEEKITNKIKLRKKK